MPKRSNRLAASAGLTREAKMTATPPIEGFTGQEKAESERQEDLERWKRYQLAGRGIPHSAVKEWLDSWGS